MAFDQFAERIPMASSTLQGRSTWPEIQKQLGADIDWPADAANQAAPRRRISGANRNRLDMLTVVGQP